jgi:hypothetical protein
MFSLAEAEDVVPTVVSFLDEETQLNAARLVGRKWYHAVADGRYMRLGFTKSRRHQEIGPLEVHWVGNFPVEASSDSDNNTTARRDTKRTRGHLPEPHMDFDHGCVEQRTIHVLSLPKTSILVRAEKMVSLDLNSVKEEDSVILLSSAVLSHLGNLLQVTARNNKTLKSISLPPSLLGLDLSFAGKLQTILFPVIASSQTTQPTHCQLQSLNLNGCRSLHTLRGPSWSQMASHLQEIDLSSCPKLQNIAHLLQATKCLRLVSLRRVATDEVLSGLAQSESASTTLRWVDAAFSQELTDKGVNALVDATVRLERLNLRSCPRVSSQCYNQTPIRLVQRKNATGTTASGRKGDNLFHLLSPEDAHKPRKRPKR